MVFQMENLEIASKGFRGTIFGSFEHGNVEYPPGGNLKTT